MSRELRIDPPIDGKAADAAEEEEEGRAPGGLKQHQFREDHDCTTKKTNEPKNICTNVQKSTGLKRDGRPTAPLWTLQSAYRLYLDQSHMCQLC